MPWTALAREFEDAAFHGDANVEWVFDAARGIRHQWLISEEDVGGAHRQLWDLFLRAGRALPTEGAPRSVFPRRLLADPSPDWRWLSALRHVKIHVVHHESPGFRSDCGMIYAVAKASAELCRRLAESERFPRVGPDRAIGSDSDAPAPPGAGVRESASGDYA